MYSPYLGFNASAIDLYVTNPSIDGDSLCIKLNDVSDTKERFASQNLKIIMQANSSPNKKYKDAAEVLKEYFGDAGGLQAKYDSTNDTKFFSGCIGSASSPVGSSDYRMGYTSLNSPVNVLEFSNTNPDAIGMLKFVICGSSSAPASTAHFSGPENSIFGSAIVNVDDIKDKEMLIKYYQDNVPCKVKISFDTEINCLVIWTSDDPGHTSTAYIHVYAYNKVPV